MATADPRKAATRYEVRYNAYDCGATVTPTVAGKHTDYAAAQNQKDRMFGLNGIDDLEIVDTWKENQ